jgi:hypothetical protein
MTFKNPHMWLSICPIPCVRSTEAGQAQHGLVKLMSYTHIGHVPRAT